MQQSVTLEKRAYQSGSIFSFPKDIAVLADHQMMS